jgi:hypothetical protein
MMMNLSVFHQGYAGGNLGGREFWYSYWNGTKCDQDAKVQNVGMSESPSAVHNVPSANIVDLRRSAATDDSVESDDSPKAKSPSGDGGPELSDLDRALLEAAEEMSFNWPEFLPVERIGERIAQMALALLLFAALLAFGHFLF